MESLDYVVSAWDISQMVYLYTQLYGMPLVVMFILSAMTIYRREMSCNSVYHLVDEAPTNATTPVTATSSVEGEAAEEEVVDDVVNANENNDNQRICSISEHDEISPAGRIGTDTELQLAKPYNYSPPKPSKSTTGSSSKPCLVRPPSSREQLQTDLKGRELVRVIFMDLLRWNWTEESTYALNKVTEDVIDLAFESMAGLAALILPTRRIRRARKPNPLHPNQFPADVQVNIMSFLHPKDVVTFACASRACRDIVDGQGPTTKAIWKTLWQRDYGWIMRSWEVGRQAYIRSNVREPAFGKEFYFRFTMSYLNYILAGCNTPEKCLVGLHGSIYDITDFVVRHPGSPETLYVHAGRDASTFFDDMDHSKRARQLAKEFCIAVDESYGATGSFGLKPTAEFEADRPTPPIVEADPVIAKKERRERHPECLKKVYEDFIAEEKRQRKEFKQKMKSQGDVLHSKTFYDPFRGEWTAWYTSTDFEVVFL